MRNVTRKHLSVVGGRARYAKVTVAELATSDAEGLSKLPILVLNDREMQDGYSDHENLIKAAISGLQETEEQLAWRGLPLRVVRIESSYVDVHPDAVRVAAIDATTAIIRGEQ